MVTFDFTQKISNFLYQWILDATEGDPRGTAYRAIFSNDGPQAGHGMEYCLFFLLFTSLVTAVIFYFGISSNIRNATRKNYLWSYIGGFICLVAINYVGMQFIVEDANILSSFNMVRVCLIDIVYYTILFELISLGIVMTNWSKAGDLHLWTLLK